MSMTKLQQELPLALAKEMQTTGRCSFKSKDRFSAFEDVLAGEACQSAFPNERDIRRLKPLYQTPREANPAFVAAAAKGAVVAKLSLATQAAQQNSSTTRTPYQAPSNHKFRERPSPLKWVLQANGRDFQVKFAIPSNQDIRRRTARDQEGFFGAAHD